MNHEKILEQNSQKNDKAQKDPIDTEDGETMLFDVGGKEADHHQGRKKGGEGPCQKKAKLDRGEDKSEFYEFEKRISNHNGYGEKESKFRGGGSADPQAHSSDDGTSRAGGAGNDGKGLEKTDEKGIRKADVFYFCNRRGFFSFKKEKYGTVKDQRKSDHDGHQGNFPRDFGMV